MDSAATSWAGGLADWVGSAGSAVAGLAGAGWAADAGWADSAAGTAEVEAAAAR